MINVVCVNVGTSYPLRYVMHLQRMVATHLSVDHQFYLLTDQRFTNLDDIEIIDIKSYGLHSWFAKMLIFNRDLMPEGTILYIDLDMVIAGDLQPLVDLDIDYEFGICENFTQIRQRRDGGKVTWPCGFGSCVMLLGKEYGPEVWDRFNLDQWYWISKARQFGDQWIIEEITVGKAVILQDVLPPGYFLHYRDFTDEPTDASILVFAGKTKPADCKYEWIRSQWR